MHIQMRYDYYNFYTIAMSSIFFFDNRHQYFTHERSNRFQFRLNILRTDVSVGAAASKPPARGRGHAIADVLRGVKIKNRDQTATAAGAEEKVGGDAIR